MSQKDLEFSHSNNMYIYNNIILKYTYPCYMSNTDLTLDEIKAIKIDEYAFVKNKIHEYNSNITVIQIPRILYDLFNILYQIRTTDMFSFEIFDFMLESSEYMINYSSYTEYTNILNRRYIDDIIKLNNIITEYITSQVSTEELLKLMDVVIDKIYTELKDKYKKLFNIDKIIEYYVYTKDLQKKIPSEYYLIILKLHKYNLSKIDVMNKDILNTIFDDDYFYSIKSEIYVDKYNDFDTLNWLFIPNHNMKNNIKLLKQVLINECKNYNNNILYRSFYESMDNVITNDGKSSYSLSFNTSILNGILSDYSACTYYYMTRIRQESPTNHSIVLHSYKYQYSIQKYFYKDGSIESNLFFIPPIHPFFQLNCSGELWHVRTLIASDSNIENVKGIDKGLYGTIIDYLMSMFDLELMKLEFNNYTSINQQEIIDREQRNMLYYNKYLKYKIKYLFLRS
jgi:hypothetical protein